ncbi:M48 family metalloprotease [Amycolatopsis sp. NPDC049868]|uniref:M48 family metalloprotease n=1 Tax=Amycolatopsis sp. NPDC049868 TaxID=3363934 RepID=UPI0037AAFE11
MRVTIGNFGIEVTVMPRDGVGRRLLSAVADSSPAFSHSPTAERGGRGRRLLAALADSPAAFRSGGDYDTFVSGLLAQPLFSYGMYTRVPRTRSWSNIARTVLTLGGTIGLIILITSLWSRTVLFIGLGFALLLTGYAYFSSNRLVLRAMRAQPVAQSEQPVLYRVVKELAMTARQPMPRIYVSPTIAPNAFATGRTPRNAAVCCTTGLLELLDERELRAVLGHQLARIHNRDTLLLSIAGALSSTVSLIGILGYAAPILADDDQPSPLAVLFMASLGPVAAVFVRVPVSRSVYRHADADSVDLTDDPTALVSALRKLERAVRAAPLAPEAAIVTQAHLLMVNPFRDSERASRLFLRHPPIAERIRFLEEMAEGR